MTFIHTSSNAKSTHLQGFPPTTEGGKHRAMCGVLGDLVESSDHQLCKSCQKKADSTRMKTLMNAEQPAEQQPSASPKINNLWEMR